MAAKWFPFFFAQIKGARLDHRHYDNQIIFDQALLKFLYCIKDFIPGYVTADGKVLDTPAALIKLSVTRQWQRELTQLRHRRSRSFAVLVGQCYDLNNGFFALEMEKELLEKERLTVESEVVTEAFDALPHDRWKEIVRMHFGFDGREPMTMTDIARIQGKSKSAVQAQMSKALAFMRNHIHEREGAAE